jgi:uncharacterized protein
MLVVSNTSPLTNLAAIDRFDLLQALFGEVHIAAGVWQELNAGNRPYPGAKEVEASRWVHRHAVRNRPLVETLRRDLDPGEAETLALALELKADLVLLDEREARRAAVRVGLKRLGVLGILLEASCRCFSGSLRASCW